MESRYARYAERRRHACRAARDYEPAWQTVLYQSGHWFCPPTRLGFSTMLPGVRHRLQSAQTKYGSTVAVAQLSNGLRQSSQLLATELFSALRVSGGAAKSIVFSDSRQDAARAALDIERRHHQDTRRQLLVESLRAVAAARPSSQQLRDMEVQLQQAVEARNFAEAGRLGQDIARAQQAVDASRVALSEVIEPIVSAGATSSEAICGVMSNWAYIPRTLPASSSLPRSLGTNGLFLQARAESRSGLPIAKAGRPGRREHTFVMSSVRWYTKSYSPRLTLLLKRQASGTLQ